MKVFEPLTGLRGLAAVWVVLIHVFTGRVWLIEAGALGVDVFFVLSGFIIAHVHARDFAAGIRLRTMAYFLGLRLARIYPLHVVTTLALVPLVFLPDFASGFRPNAFSGLNFVMNLILVQNWTFFFLPQEVLGPGWSWNAPAWSLSVEWFLYLAFPIMAAIVLRIRSTAVLVTVAVVAMIAMLAIMYRHHGELPLGLMGRSGMVKGIAEFASGVCLYRAWDSSSAFRDACERSCTVAAFVFIAVASFLPIAALSVFALVVIIPGLAEGDGWFARLCGSRPVKYLGEISFSLYLCHLPIVLLANYVADVVGYAAWDSHLTPFHFVLLAVILAVSHFVYHAVERPARAAGRRLISADHLRQAHAT